MRRLTIVYFFTMTRECRAMPPAPGHLTRRRTPLAQDAPSSDADVRDALSAARLMRRCLTRSACYATSIAFADGFSAGRR